MIEIDEIPVETETTTDPDDDGQSTYIHASVIGIDRRNHTASCYMDGAASDEEVAAGLVRAALAVANMHSAGAWMALQRLLADGRRDEESHG